MKIICIGRNYAEHAAELNNPVPQAPVIFMKPSTALLTDGKPFYHPEFSNNIHYELEVVLKIKKNGKYIQSDLAHEYYDYIGLGIDLTARDIQDQLKAKGHPWETAKAFDHSAVISNFFPLNEYNKDSIHFTLKKNGEVVQDGNTAEMIFNFDYIISYVSRFFTLQVGDLVYTGTPKGVGKISVGDVLEGFLEGRQVISCLIK